MKKCIFLISFALILLFPALSLRYAASGLHLWFECMVPVLLPFMILSGVMIRQNLTEGFAGALFPFLGRLYKISRNGVYCVIIGFLCGFPMGARTIAELYGRNGLSKREAGHLLAFCNNIGPVYYISFLLPAIGYKRQFIVIYLFGMYGIPLLYGLFLRLTGFGLGKPEASKPSDVSKGAPCTENIAVSLDESMQSAITGITTLGGYMILFNLMNLLPHALCLLFSAEPSGFLPDLCSCLFEITGGVKRMGDRFPFFVLVLIPLGGLSCIAQTKSMLRGTDLSMANYLLHKCVQTGMTAVFYLLFFRLLF